MMRTLAGFAGTALLAVPFSVTPTFAMAVATVRDGVDVGKSSTSTALPLAYFRSLRASFEGGLEENGAIDQAVSDHPTVAVGPLDRLSQQTDPLILLRTRDPVLVEQYRQGIYSEMAQTGINERRVLLQPSDLKEGKFLDTVALKDVPSVQNLSENVRSLAVYGFIWHLDV